MNIVIAIDSFKGSISSMDAGNAVKERILQKYPEDSVAVYPVADGGEGTVDALVEGLHGTIVPVTVTGPLGKPVASRYGYLPQENIAVIEMADAAGITMVPKAQLNPLNTTTYGLGELILAAINNGCRNFILGLGGSATNDAGLGMLTALGVKFLQKDGTPAGIYGRNLANVETIDLSGMNPLLQDCTFNIACDVENPLCGLNGCSAVFGPQKGATPDIVKRMDKDIYHFGMLAELATNRRGLDLKGAGAAGGLGFAFHTFLNGNLVPGIDLILNAIHIEEALKTADILITGEGRMDSQTAMGKAPVGIAKLALKANPACITLALCGAALPDAEAVNAAGIDAYFPILHTPMSVEEAMQKETTVRNLQQTAVQVLNLIHR